MPNSFKGRLLYKTENILAFSKFLALISYLKKYLATYSSYISSFFKKLITFIAASFYLFEIPLQSTYKNSIMTQEPMP